MNLVTCPKFEPVMSKEATLDTMRRCVELGARFLVNKPVDANTIHNIWQHLDIKIHGWTISCIYYKVQTNASH